MSDRPADLHLFRGWPTRLALLFALGLLARVWLILRYPVVFGGDTILRLANHDQIALAYQLPALQVAIHVLYGISENPVVVRAFLAVVGAATSAGMYLLVRPLVGPGVALATGAVFALNPLILPLSTVPYQEILMLAGLVFGFAAAFRGRWGWAALALGLACLTRYEAWLACPILLWAYLWEEGVSVGNVVKGGLLFGWAPLAWIGVHGGITPEGTYAVEGTLNLERFVRWAYLGWITLKHTPLPALLVAPLGVWALIEDGSWKRKRPVVLLEAFLVVFMVAILFSAHGTGENPERTVTIREAHIPLVGMTVLFGIGLARLSRRMKILIVAATLVVGAWMADGYTARQVQEPGFALSWQAASFLDERVGPGEDVVVLAHPISGAEQYLSAVEARWGEEGRRRALDVLRSTETSPPTYQRILVHSRLGRERLRSLHTLWVPAGGGRPGEVPVEPPPDDPGDPEWVVRWSHFEPTNQAEAALAARLDRTRPVHTFVAGTLEVAIYRFGSG